MKICIGEPNLRKSVNLYFPIFITIKLVWYPKGVENDALPANMMQYKTDFKLRSEEITSF